MRNFLLACALSVAWIGSASAVEDGKTYSIPYSSSTPVTTAVTVLPNSNPSGAVTAGFNQTRTWSRIFNNGSSTAPTLWCNRFGAPVIGGGSGSFPLAAAGSPDNLRGWPWYEEFGVGAALPVPQLAVQCISSGSNSVGTSGTAAGSITVEYR